MVASEVEAPWDLFLKDRRSLKYVYDNVHGNIHLDPVSALIPKLEFVIKFFELPIRLWFASRIFVPIFFFGFDLFLTLINAQLSSNVQ